MRTRNLGSVGPYSLVSTSLPFVKHREESRGVRHAADQHTIDNHGWRSHSTERTHDLDVSSHPKRQAGRGHTSAETARISNTGSNGEFLEWLESDGVLQREEQLVYLFELALLCGTLGRLGGTKSKLVIG